MTAGFVNIYSKASSLRQSVQWNIKKTRREDLFSQLCDKRTTSERCPLSVFLHRQTVPGSRFQRRVTVRIIVTGNKNPDAPFVFE